MINYRLDVNVKTSKVMAAYHVTTLYKIYLCLFDIIVTSLAFQQGWPVWRFLQFIVHNLLQNGWEEGGKVRRDNSTTLSVTMSICIAIVGLHLIRQAMMHAIITTTP